MPAAVQSQHRQRSVLVVLGVVCIILLGLLIYRGTLQAPFLFDDRGVITENEITKNLPLALRNISNMRYIGYISFALNYHYGKLDVRGYHLANVAIHIANSLILYLLMRHIFRTPGLKAGGYTEDFVVYQVAFLFLAHPLQIQAVSYISQRFTSLSTFFYLGSLLFYLKARLSLLAKDQKSTFNAAFLFLLSVLSAMLAMKTKEIAYTLPLMALLFELIFLKPYERGSAVTGLIFPLILLLVPAVLMFSGMTILKKTVADMAASIDALSRETVQISRTEYLLTQANVVVTYIRLMLFPVNQNLDYDYPVSTTFLSFDMTPPVIMIGILVCITFTVYKRARLVSFGLVWFFIALLVESSIIPIRDVINEHRMYLPSIGLSIASGAAIDRGIRNEKAKLLIVSLIIMLFSVATISRNRVWSDPELLWSDVISKAPNNARAFNNLGTVFKEQKLYDLAREQFEKALHADKNYSAVYYNLGDVQYRLGHYEKALEYLDTAIRGHKDNLLHVDILNKMGRTYGAMGNREMAIENFRKAMELYPASPVPRNNLAVQYIKAGKPDEAIAVLQEALSYAPYEDYLYLNLANAYDAKGDEKNRDLMNRKAAELRRTGQK